MPSGAELPSVQQVLDVAATFGLDITEEQATSYQSLMQGTLRSYRRLEELVEAKPQVKYPRDTGYRPAAEENPYNAWYWRCQIQGAANGPLTGYTVGVKDAICVAGIPMMNGSRVFEGYIPDVDATVVTRLLDAGATIVGKTNAADCSFSGGGHSCALGPVRNPHKPTHAPGGSSKGSAVAVATGDVPMALGGDQGGSIRIPAAWCGVVGLKPTYGLVPYTGGMMIEMTLDHLGPMTDTVENCARMLSVIAGPDPLDPRQRGVIPDDYMQDYSPAIGMGCQGIKIGVVKEGFDQLPWEDLGLPGSNPEVDRKVREAVKQLEKKGATVSDVSIPMHYDGLHIWNGIAVEGICEFMIKGCATGTNWSGFYNTGMLEAVARGMRSRINDLPHTVKSLMLLGGYMNQRYYGRYYAKAQNLKGLLTTAYDDVLASYDVLVMPTIPNVATPIPPSDCSIEDYVYYGLSMINNTPQFNVTGHASISVPCGLVEGLPVGMMITGKRFDDFTVLQVADAFEKIGDWKRM